MFATTHPLHNVRRKQALTVTLRKSIIPDDFFFQGDIGVISSVDLLYSYISLLKLRETHVHREIINYLLIIFLNSNKELRKFYRACQFHSSSMNLLSFALLYFYFICIFIKSIIFIFTNLTVSSTRLMIQLLSLGRA